MQVRRIIDLSDTEVYGLVAITNASCIAYRSRGELCFTPHALSPLLANLHTPQYSNIHQIAGAENFELEFMPKIGKPV